MSQEIMHIAVNSVDILDVKKSCLNECNKCLELETGLLKKKDLIEKDVYDKLLKSYSTLQKHCISLELTTQLNQEIFQKENFHENQNAPTFNQLFKINELKAQSQEKDTVISKLKDRIKSLSGKDNVENVKKDIDEIKMINIELEHNLNAQLQEKDFAIAALKNELKKLKGKDVIDTAVSKPSATIAPRMFKLDIEHISHRLKNNRDAHEVYLEKTIENTNILCGLVECARKRNPSEPLLEYTCMFIKHIQELLVCVSKTYPSLTKPCEKLVVVTPINKDKKVRFFEHVTSLSNIPKQTGSLKTKDSNKPLLTSIGVKPTTSASGLKPSSNTKNNRITRPPSSNQKNKVEEYLRKVKSSLNKMNSISEPVSNVHVKHSVRNANIESICAICNKILFYANHDMCVIDYVNDVNVRSKSKSKRNKMRKVWKPTGKVFSQIGYSWKPIGRNFTIVGNRCPLTRITSTKVVPTKETSTKSVATPTQGIIVYSRRPKATRYVEAVATACYTQNRSLIQKCHNKTPYELLHDRKPNLSYLHVFGALCYPTNDGEDLESIPNLQQKDANDIETIHVNFDELTTMAFEQFSLGPRPKLLTPGTINSGLMPNIPSSTPYVLPTKNDWEILFQPMFDEYLNPPPCVDLQVPTIIAPEPAVSTDTPSSTTINQDAPSTSTSQTTPETPSLVIPLGVEEADHDIKVAHMDNNPYVDFQISKPSSEESSTQVVIPNNVHSINQPPEQINKWTKDHSIDNVIGDPSKPVSTRHQLQDALFCYFDAFLSFVEPRSYKEALTESC
ncbi:hypothetical protein Tco_0676651 [Tanacetum coccineum]